MSFLPLRGRLLGGALVTHAVITDSVGWKESHGPQSAERTELFPFLDFVPTGLRRAGTESRIRRLAVRQ